MILTIMVTGFPAGVAMEVGCPKSAVEDIIKNQGFWTLVNKFDLVSKKINKLQAWIPYHEIRSISHEVSE